jgi:hypothetical protein
MTSLLSKEEDEVFEPIPRPATLKLNPVASAFGVSDTESSI